MREELVIVALAALLTTTGAFNPHDGLSSRTRHAANNEPVNRNVAHTTVEKRIPRQENSPPTRLRDLPEISNNRHLEAIADRTLSKSENKRYLDSIGKSIAKKLSNKIRNRKTIRHNNGRQFSGFAARETTDHGSSHPVGVKQETTDPVSVPSHLIGNQDQSGNMDPFGFDSRSLRNTAIDQVDPFHTPNIKNADLKRQSHMDYNENLANTPVPADSFGKQVLNDPYPIEKTPLDYGRQSKNVPAIEPVHLDQQSILRDKSMPKEREAIDYNRPSSIIDSFDPFIDQTRVVDKTPLDYGRPPNADSTINSVDAFNSPSIQRENFVQTQREVPIQNVIDPMSDPSHSGHNVAHHVDKNPLDYVRQSETVIEQNDFASPSSVLQNKFAPSKRSEPTDYSLPSSVPHISSPLEPRNDPSRFGDNHAHAIKSPIDYERSSKDVLFDHASSLSTSRDKFDKPQRKASSAYSRSSLIAGTINPIVPFHESSHVRESTALPVDKNPIDYARQSKSSSAIKPADLFNTSPIRRDKFALSAGKESIDYDKSSAATIDRINPLSSRFNDVPPFQRIRPSIDITAMDPVGPFNDPPASGLVETIAMSQDKNPVDYGSALRDVPVDPTNTFHNPSALQDVIRPPVIARTPVDAFNVEPISGDTLRMVRGKNPLDYNGHL